MELKTIQPDAGIDEKMHTLKKAHIFKETRYKRFYSNTEIYSGNISLCGKIWLSDDGEYSTPFSKLTHEEHEEKNICKKCLKISQSLKPKAREE